MLYTLCSNWNDAKIQIYVGLKVEHKSADRGPCMFSAIADCVTAHQQIVLFIEINFFWGEDYASSPEPPA